MPRGSTAHVVAAVVYSLIALLWCRPLLTDFGRLVPSDLGDPLLSTWALWWNADVVPFSAAWWDGLAFFPTHGTMAFSDHRVGLGLITTPLIWLGATPLAAYNIAFVLSFILSALAAYALGAVVTGNTLAAFIGGLVFGFHPFRAEHLAHLELLATYWLPIFFLALHRWLATQHPGWLAVVAVALLAQGLTGGYYFVFLAPLTALWLLWFLPRLPLRSYVALAVALIAPAVALAPIFMKYREIHRHFGLQRALSEIEFFSADVRGLITAPERLLLWNTPAAWTHPEGSIFPGVTVVILVITAAVASRRRPMTPQPARVRLLRRLALAVMAIAVVAALFPLSGHPVVREVMGIPISITNAFKPFSVALLLLTWWVITSPHLLVKRRSPLAFYVLATLAMWAFALGPTAKLLGDRILWTTPYALAMALPGFADGFRAPARFAMLAALTMSVAAALAWARLSAGARAPARAVAAIVVCAGILADGWIVPLPVVPAPTRVVVPQGIPSNAAIVELPLGVLEDSSAVYRSTFHGHRVVNGLSGYDPPHYPMLRQAIAEGRYEALSVFAGAADLMIVVWRQPAGNPGVASDVQARAAARHIDATETHDVFLLPRRPDGASHHAIGRPRPAQTLVSSDNSNDLPLMSDGDQSTEWVTHGRQQQVNQFIADFGAAIELTGLSLLLGRDPAAFPRALRVEVSIDETTWEVVWQGETTIMAIAAAMSRPRDATITLPFTAHGRYVRVSQTGNADHPWAVAEFRALATE